MRASVINYQNINEKYNATASWTFKVNVYHEEFFAIQNKPPFFDGSLPSEIKAEFNKSIEEIILPEFKDNNKSQSV